MYTVILPTMAAKGTTPLHGEVWLPHIQCIADRQEKLWVSLQQYFRKQLIADPNENPLYRATQNVEE